VLASGAGASARKSIGITVFTGMIASTCLACCSCRRSSWWCSASRSGARRANAQSPVQPACRVAIRSRTIPSLDPLAAESRRPCGSAR
jgi:hypothetical protein